MSRCKSRSTFWEQVCLSFCAWKEESLQSEFLLYKHRNTDYRMSKLENILVKYQVSMDSLPCSPVLNWVPLLCQKPEYAKKPFSVIFPGRGPLHHIWYRTFQQSSCSRILSPASMLGTQKITQTLKNIFKHNFYDH